MSYLGYLNTTGLQAMDYRITDASADPGGASEHYHAERLLRLPRSMWCYEPRADAPPLSPLPARTAGFATFGSFNHPLKLNSDVLALWVRLLRECGDSRLVVMPVPDDDAADRLRRPFREAGITDNRVRILPRMPRDAFLRLMSEVDIALDPFPYNGGATTCDCLWMGVPVVSLAGSFGFARSGASLLRGSGLSELVAGSSEEYLAIARGLATDLDTTSSLRSSLRARLGRFDAWDAPAFVADLERAYEAAVRELSAG
jgi:predicted O-linked N-acetylglucosamine transferase (SPINDLY family)